MMRRVALLALPLFMTVVAGCKDEARAPIQTVPARTVKSNPESDLDKSPPTPEQSKLAMDRLDKAIAAHGGPVRLQKMRRHIQLRKGKLLTGRFGEVDSEQDLRMQFPDHVRLSVRGFTPEGKQDIMLVLNGNTGWMKDGSGVRELTAEVARDVNDELHYFWLVTLLPLKDAEYTLRPIDGVPVFSQPTVGIRVTANGRQPLNLFFDEKTNLLVGTSGQLRSAGVLQRHEVTYTDFKSFDDLKLASRVVDMRDGARWQNCTVEYKFVKEFDAAEFSEPK